MEDGQEALVAQGGSGGRGNARFVTSINQEPLLREVGEAGESYRVHLEVKLIADVGVIGVPNAGKSSFVGRVTAASPRVAAYPFTTLEPQLGVVETRGKPVVLAEIPGLIEGAHLGVGLGHDFLRHAERTRLFLHLIDGGGLDPLADYRQVNEELAQYDAALADRPQDGGRQQGRHGGDPRATRRGHGGAQKDGGVPRGDVRRDGRGRAVRVGPRAAGPRGFTPPPPTPAVAAPPRAQRRRPRRTGAIVRDEEGGFVVEWPAAERLVVLSDVEDYRVVGQLLHEFRRLGVIAALEVCGSGIRRHGAGGRMGLPLGRCAATGVSNSLDCSPIPAYLPYGQTLHGHATAEAAL